MKRILLTIVVAAIFLAATSTACSVVIIRSFSDLDAIQTICLDGQLNALTESGVQKIIIKIKEDWFMIPCGTQKSAGI